MATPTETVEAPAAEEPAKATGTLASILTPVQPARPVERIGSTASMAEESIATDSGSTAGKADRSSKPEHPVGALVRAIASRIGRTGTQNTVKRQHTITENRMTGNQVNTQHRINRDAKHHHIAQSRDNRDAKLADLNNKIQQHSGRDHRDSKDSNAKASTQNGASKTGRDVKDHRDAKTSGATSNKQDVMHQTGRDGLDGKPAKTSDAKPTKADTTAPKDAKPTDTAAEKPNGGTKTGPGNQRPDQKPPTKDKTTTDETPAMPRPRTQSSREAGYHDGTRAAKVANQVKAYRDGVQDGYADGTVEYEREKRRMDDAKAKNATRPTTPAAPKMAPASGSTADLAKKPTHTPADRPTPDPAASMITDSIRFASPDSPPLIEPLTDIKVGPERISYTTDAGGYSGSAHRAEVRTLRGFERRMTEKIPRMQQVAENSKGARATAAEHATRARRLAELARDVEGGDRLIGKLDRLAEKADALQHRTEEIEKAAHRGAEALRALVANANTRHGGIYKAVADSPLTSPAERKFYQDKEGS